jgi:hypothetical protein
VLADERKTIIDIDELRCLTSGGENVAHEIAHQSAVLGVAMGRSSGVIERSRIPT